MFKEEYGKILSKNLMVYPCAYRGKGTVENEAFVYDPSSRMFTEKHNREIYENLITYKNSEIYRDGGSLILTPDYVIKENDTDPKTFSFILAGYRFNIYEAQTVFTKKQEYYAHIRVEDSKKDENNQNLNTSRLVYISKKSEQDNVLSLDSTKESGVDEGGEYYFDGLIISNSAAKIITTQKSDSTRDITEHVLKLFNADGKVPTQNRIMFNLENICGSARDENNNSLLDTGELNLSEALDTKKVFTSLIYGMDKDLEIKTSKENISLSSTKQISITAGENSVKLTDGNINLFEDITYDKDSKKLTVTPEVEINLNASVPVNIGECGFSMLSAVYDNDVKCIALIPNEDVEFNLGSQNNRLNNTFSKNEDIQYELNVGTKANIKGNLIVEGVTNLNAKTTISADLDITGTNTNITNNFQVGSKNKDGKADFYAPVNIYNTLTVNKTVNFGSNLNVEDDIRINKGKLEIQSDMGIKLGDCGTISVDSNIVDSSVGTVPNSAPLVLSANNYRYVKATNSAGSITLVDDKGDTRTEQGISAGNGYNIYCHNIKLYGFSKDSPYKNHLSDIRDGSYVITFQILSTRSAKFDLFTELWEHLTKLATENKSIILPVNGYGGNDKDRPALFLEPISLSDKRVLKIAIETDGSKSADTYDYIIIDSDSLGKRKSDSTTNVALGLTDFSYRIGLKGYYI